MEYDYDGYSYERFRELAQNPHLSVYQKTGFPDSYRENLESLIFEDIAAKCPRLHEENNLNVLDIGPGCSGLQKNISKQCQSHRHSLFLADSAEMLQLIQDESFTIKIPGFFPDSCQDILTLGKKMDVIICYSMFHYIYAESNVWRFIDAILALMNDGGEAIIGDIPNISKRKRFFSSANGVAFHQDFMKTSEVPDVSFNVVEPGKIDDSVLLAVMLHCQSSGFDAYLVPQKKGLPFSNRRDDILIRKP